MRVGKVLGSDLTPRAPPSRGSGHGAQPNLRHCPSTLSLSLPCPCCPSLSALPLSPPLKQRSPEPPFPLSGALQLPCPPRSVPSAPPSGAPPLLVARRSAGACHARPL